MFIGGFCLYGSVVVDTTLLEKHSQSSQFFWQRYRIRLFKTTTIIDKQEHLYYYLGVKWSAYARKHGIDWLSG
jgi:hypothetical protein